MKQMVFQTAVVSAARVRYSTSSFTIPPGGMYSMKRSNLFLASLAVLVTAWSSLFAQTHDFYVSGKVQDASGKPIGGATASLTSLANRLSWDFSDSTTGNFGKAVTSVIKPASRQIGFSLPAAGAVRAELFGVTGKKIATLSNVNLDKGVYSFNLPPELNAALASSVYIVKITAGDKVSYRKVLNTGDKNGITAGVAASISAAQDGTFRKITSGTVIDTLRVGKTGYAAVKIPITSDTIAVGTVTLTKINIDSLVAAMLGTMSTTELIGQLDQIDCPQASEVTGMVLGTIFGGGTDGPAGGAGTAAQWVSWNDNYRQMGSGFKTPIMTEWDVVHGFGKCNGATVYPHNIGLGATWDTLTVQKCYRVGGLEARGCGVILGYGPCIAVPRNYLWGRVYEGFSGSPALTSAMARAAVLGYQTTDLSNPLSFAGCVKHFAGDGGTDGGINPGNTSCDVATMDSVFLPGYAAAIKAGVECVMSSYSTWQQPGGQAVNCTENPALLTTWLKTQQGFDGYVNSDWSATYQFGNDPLTAFRAGLDVSMLGSNYDNVGNPTIAQAVTTMINNGGTDQARIKDAVSRVLRIKYKMDLKDQPLTTNSALTALVGCQAHRDIAREAVRKSLVLLKTTTGLLPLSKSANVTLVGPDASDIGVQCGGWTLGWQGQDGNAMPGTTIQQGFQSVGAGTITTSADGTTISGDVAVVCIGEIPYAETAGDITGGGVEKSLSVTALPNANIITNAINTAHGSGKKVIVVMLTGRPLDISGILGADAIVAAWLPGTEGGGIAEVLYGTNAAGTAHYDFTGKLGMAWPKDANSEPTNNGVGTNPRFAYGYGLNSAGNQLPAGLYGAGVNP